MEELFFMIELFTLKITELGHKKYVLYIREKWGIFYG